LLAVNPASAPTHVLPAGLLRHTIEAFVAVYNPLFVLVFLGVIVWVDRGGDGEMQVWGLSTGRFPKSVF
jgi:hypothetical protein